MIPKNKPNATIRGALILLFIFLSCGTALAGGLGNNPPVISSLTANPNPIFPGGDSGLTCIATDSDGAITKYEWTADGGTFPNGETTQIFDAPINTIVWTAPAETGYYNISVTVYDDGSIFGGPPATATEYISIFVDGQNNSPIITSLVPEADSVFLGASIFVTISATDPDGDPLAYEWSASGGTITGDNDLDPEAIIWTAPQVGTDCTLTATVTDGIGGAASQSVIISVILARETGNIKIAGVHPVRIDTDQFGQIYVSDTTRGRVLILSEDGDYLGGISGLNGPIAVALGPAGRLYIGEDGSDRVSIYDVSGAFLGTFDGPAVQMPNCIDVDRPLNKVFVVDSKSARVLVYDTSGNFQYAIDGSSAVSGGFLFPVGVAVNTASQTIYVTDAGTYQVHCLDYDGNSIINFGSRGSGNGQFTRVQGIDIDDEGRIFVADSFQSRLQVFDATGQFLATVGIFGSGAGQLKIPVDANVARADRLLVASNDNARIEVYSLTDDLVPLPNEPPGEPMLDLPLAGSEVATHNPELVALPAIDPDGDELTYTIEVVEDGHIEPSASVSGLYEAEGVVSWTVQPSLAENTFYHWSAQATDGMDAGPWTAQRTFYVNAVNEDPTDPAEIFTPPGAELRPDDTLEWGASFDPDALDIVSFVLEIDDDEDFSSILIQQNNIQSTGISLEALTDYDLLVDDTLYYWRVKAVDNHGGESGWAYGSFYFNRIEIEIACTPADADVYIDGNPAYPGWYAGMAPMTVMNVTETFHVVTLVKEGYASYSTIVDNRFGMDSQVDATLTPAEDVVLSWPKWISLDMVYERNITNLRPFIMDWNFDGIPDLLFSDDSRSVFLDTGEDSPIFSDSLLLDAVVVFGFEPREASLFPVDWDNDADFDMLIGTRNDGVLLALNDGDQENANFVDGGNVLVQGQDPLPTTVSLAPAVIDWDGDGRKDLLVGGMSGQVGIYINSGTDEAPEFLTEELVEADGEILTATSGYAVPYATDWNRDGLTDLLIGTHEGSIYLYQNVGTRGSPVFTNMGPVEYNFNPSKTRVVNPGLRSTPCFADWDGDGVRDFVSGNMAGNLVILNGFEPKSKKNKP